MQDKWKIWELYKKEEAKIIHLFKEAFPLEWENSIGNDSALLSVPKGEKILITQDLLLEQVHFFPDIPTEALAYKSLMVNMSDIFADGGTPTSFLLGLQIPPFQIERAKELAEYLIFYSKKYGMRIIGGDTVTSSQFGISVVCVGHVQTPWLRKNAKVGDRVYVTGTLGSSRKGFSLLKEGASQDSDNHWINRHYYPPYRYPLVEYLVSQNLPIHAAVDVSDGFLEDFTQILLESEKSASLSLKQIPKEEEVSLDEALWGGEDYELILCCPVELPVVDIREKIGVPLTYVGDILSPIQKTGEIFSQETGENLNISGDFKKFFHF